jgi:hypothetical protein
MRRTVPFVLCLFLVACTPTITRTEYDQKCREAVNFNNTLTGEVYYQGSKDGYDYFLFEPFGAISHHARVKEGDVALTQRIPYSGDRSKWVVAYPDWPGMTNIVIQTGATNK